MKFSGENDTTGCDMLITSAVAILFSVSSSDTCPRSDLFCYPRRLSIGRSMATKVRLNLLAALFFFLLGRGIIHFHVTARTQRAQNLVTAGHDLVALFKSLDHFNIGCASDPGVHRDEFRFMIAQHEDPLDLLLLFR